MKKRNWNINMALSMTYNIIAFWQNVILSSKLQLEIVLFWNPEVARQPQQSGGWKVFLKN